MSGKDWIIKLGGSTLKNSKLLSLFLKRLAGYPLLLIPGGGVYADLVRTEQRRVGFSDAAAHWMSIVAMQQSGLVMLDLCPELIACQTLDEARTLMHQGKTCIWLPAPEHLRLAFGIDENWDFTSDSIALWACHKISSSAQLLLVKSCALPTCQGKITVQSAQGYDWIDAGFSRVWTDQNHTVWITQLDENLDWSLASVRPSHIFHQLIRQ